MLNYRFFFLGLIGILATFASHASVTILEPSDSDGFAEIQVQLSPPKFSRSAASTPITLELENPSGYPAVLYRPGFPELPVLRFFVQGEVQVSSTGATLIHTLSKTETLKVSQPPAPKVPNKMQATELAPEFLNSDEIWPKEAYSLEKAGFVNGVERKLLTIYPVSIEPKTQKLFFRESFKIHATRVNAQLGESRERESLPELFTFVVGERFLKSTALRDYEQSKREQGYEVREIQLATTSSSPEMIREQLQTLYRDPGYRMRYVLLIGDYEDVPSYQSNISDNVTDHYYACLDGPDYASDVSAPDVSVGRISARDENDLKSIFQKQTTYQRGHFSGEDWLRHPSFLATNDQWQIAEGTHNYVLDSYLKGGQYFGDFPTSHNLGGDQIFAVTHKAGAQDVLHALRTGSFFVDYSGHGSVTFWQNPQLLQPDIRSFSHRDARPFVIGNACITADFRTPESFAETWQRHSAGAIAYWGSTVLTYWGEDDILERSFADGVWKQGLTTFGETTDYAKQRLWLHYGGAELAAYYQEAYHLFGDPSLMFRFAPTEAVEITGPAVVPVGVPEVGFDLRTLSGKPVVGARVALVQKDFAQTVSGQTDVHGHVTLNLTNLDQHPGVWNRVIDPTNSALISDEFRFGQSPTPYLILDDLKVSGREGSALFAGENAALSLSVKNMGEQSAKVSTVSIESLEGPVTLLSSKTQLPTLGAGEGYSMPIGALSFEVSQNAQDGEKISAVLRWQTADGYTGLKRVNWVVERAQLEVVRVDAGDGRAGQQVRARGLLGRAGADAGMRGRSATLKGHDLDVVASA